MSMPVILDSAGDDALTSALANPLSSIEIRTHRTAGAASDEAGHAAPARPLALRELRPAPEREIPEYLYDPHRQIATDLAGRPMAPELKKDWTTIEGTHTDGDGGDNELWEWEEVQ